MQINCELPFCMFNYNTILNDYDFVLFHLYKSNERYREYYKAMRIIHPERLMVLDNSAYEFFVKGEQLNLNEFKVVIEELKPDMYILPDVLMDLEKTLSGVQKFIDNYFPECDSEPMAVAQGKTEEELIECLNIYKENNIQNICIPFHNSFFKDITPWPTVQEMFLKEYNTDTVTDDMRYAMGRVMFYKYNTKLIHSFKHIHMLGSHCPFEKFYYEGINTMDTGYPVKLGYAGRRLGQETKKPDVIIDDFLEDDLSLAKRTGIKDNIMIFKGY